MSVTEYAKYIAKEVFPVMSKVSLVLAVVVMLTMVTLTIYDYKLVDRVTLRLQTGVIIYDIWFHSLPLWLDLYNYRGSPLCTFIGFQLSFFPLYYSFLNAAIGINFQLIFLHGVTITKKIELGYWIGTLLLTLLITLPPLATGFFGYGSYKKCFVTINNENYAKMFDFFTNAFVIMICMAYLLLVVVFVVMKLLKGLNFKKERKIAIDANRSTRGIRSIKLLTSRIILYPTIMIISHIGLVINQIVIYFTDIDSHELEVISHAVGGLLGTLNFIAFFCDPTIHHALKVIYSRVIEK
ncbi:hypothetical protein K502DRAFT_353936 [Neoconidiobolus thromboides FSU 785]|nr:hypothetical protein K502DRAFT_353936 [Neoconidiobolus thromboides FSU 785]